MEGAREGGEKKEFWGGLKSRQGAVLGLETVKFSQEGVTLRLESG